MCISLQEACLASDDVLVYFFNDFLSLPVKAWCIAVNRFAQTVPFLRSHSLFPVFHRNFVLQPRIWALWVWECTSTRLFKVRQKTSYLWLDTADQRYCGQQVLCLRKETWCRNKHLKACFRSNEILAMVLRDLWPLQQLDREQGIQWIVKERLPFFLQSDCYVEYRYWNWRNDKSPIS